MQFLLPYITLKIGQAGGFKIISYSVGFEQQLCGFFVGICKWYKDIRQENPDFLMLHCVPHLEVQKHKFPKI